MDDTLPSIFDASLEVPWSVVLVSRLNDLCDCWLIWLKEILTDSADMLPESFSVVVAVSSFGRNGRKNRSLTKEP